MLTSARKITRGADGDASSEGCNGASGGPICPAIIFPLLLLILVSSLGVLALEGPSLRKVSELSGRDSFGIAPAPLLLSVENELNSMLFGDPVVVVVDSNDLSKL